ncbi:MAG TPA: protein-export chaperone SecB [Burkholderiales bacterium]|nr:protein-export chaperone SecB [Burkholderiales bacterium]
MAEPAQPQPSSEQNPPSFQIEKVYVKDLSLEIPNAPQVFVQQAQPQLEVQIQTNAAQFAEGYYECSVTATVTAKAGERTLFLAEVVQAGIFSMRNVPAQEIDPLLGIGCPTILFPYLRESISDLVTRGGFPPVLLNPVSFEAIYMQRLQQGAAQRPAESKIELAR